MCRRPIVFSILLAAATAAFADAPTSRPARESDAPARSENSADRPRDLPSIGRLIERFGGIRGPIADRVGPELMREDLPTDDEWARVSQFSQENFPVRWSLFERLRDARGEDSDFIGKVKLRIANRYRALMKAKTDMPDFYEGALTQAKEEDKAWGISQQLQHDPNSATLRGQLHDTLSNLIRTAMKERAARIDRMRQALDEEQKSYDHDNADLEDRINRRFDRMAGSNAAMEGALSPSTGEAPATNP